MKCSLIRHSGRASHACTNFAWWYLALSRKRWIIRLPGYIASIAISSMIVLTAFTVTTSSMRVFPVSRSIAP